MNGYWFPVSRQHFLSVRVYPIVSNRSLQLNALFLDNSGSLIPATAVIPVTQAGTKTESEIQCIDGHLVSLTVSDRLRTAKEGEVYIQAFIKIGEIDTDNPQAMLCRGFVYKNSPVFYPGGKDQSPTDGNGLFYHATQTNPGAGNPFTLTFNPWETFVVLNVSFRLTTSVVAANRRPFLLLSSDIGDYQFAMAPFTIPESSIADINFSTMAVVAYTDVGGRHVVPIRKTDPAIISTKALVINNMGLQANDTLTQIILTLAKYPDFSGF